MAKRRSVSINRKRNRHCVTFGSFRLLQSRHLLGAPGRYFPRPYLSAAAVRQIGKVSEQNTASAIYLLRIILIPSSITSGPTDPAPRPGSRQLVTPIK